ncbi:MAG: hypothetical protein RIQ54_399 [Candidatus Parcubacteria bacterium]|jgi:hypothetical protein
MESKLQDLLERTLKTTTPLAEAGPVGDTKFLNVLLGIYRVSLTTLRDIYYLALNEETGGSALALARKIIEYAITLEYMIWRGKEKMADRFQKHMCTEIHHELEFLKLIGQSLEGQGEELKIYIEEAEWEYAALSSDVKSRKSWAGCSIEKMIEIMYTAGQLQDFDFPRIGQAYVWGSRLNHVSPFVVHAYMRSEDAKGASDFYLRQAIMFGILFHLRISARYIEEVNAFKGSDPTP